MIHLLVLLTILCPPFVMASNTDYFDVLARQQASWIGQTLFQSPSSPSLQSLIPPKLWTQQITPTYEALQQGHAMPVFFSSQVTSEPYLLSQWHDRASHYYRFYIPLILYASSAQSQQQSLLTLTLTIMIHPVEDPAQRPLTQITDIRIGIEQQTAMSSPQQQRDARCHARK